MSAAPASPNPPARPCSSSPGRKEAVMRTVTLRSAVPYRASVLKAGVTVEVSNEQAGEWERRGLLHEGDGPTEQQLLAGDGQTNDLIARVRSGEPAAVAELRRLIGDRASQAVRPSEPGGPLEEGDEPEV